MARQKISSPQRSLLGVLARVLETVGLVPEGFQLVDSGLSTEVVNYILNARAPSTRRLYALKGNPGY